MNRRSDATRRGADVHRGVDRARHRRGRRIRDGHRRRHESKYGAAIAVGTVTWSFFSDPSVATVTPAGFITAVAPGNDQIVATAGTISARTTFTVTPVPVSTVTVEPVRHSPRRRRIAAIDGDAARRHPNTRTAARWCGRRATLKGHRELERIGDGRGQRHGRHHGHERGTIGVGGHQRGPEPVASVTVTPPTATVIVGNTASFVATAVGATGTALTGRTSTWTSSIPRSPPFPRRATRPRQRQSPPERQRSPRRAKACPPPWLTVPRLRRRARRHRRCISRSATYGTLTAAQFSPLCVGGNTFASESCRFRSIHPPTRRTTFRCRSPARTRRRFSRGRSPRCTAGRPRLPPGRARRP